MRRHYWSDPAHAPLPWKPLAYLWVGCFVTVVVACEAVDRARGKHVAR